MRTVTCSLSIEPQILGHLARPKMAQRTSGQTRRTVLGGGLAAAAWGLSASAGADAPAPGANDFVSLEAAPTRLPLAPPPAETSLAYAYRGAIPGPLLRVRQGAELRLRIRQQACRADDAELSGLAGVERGRGRRRPDAGAPQAWRQHRDQVRCSRRRLQSLPAARGPVRRFAAGARAVRADHCRGDC